MVMDLLNTILKDLEKYINITDLHTDKNESCQIVYKNGFEVQLELDPTGEFLCVGTRLGVIPKGRYRQTLFREALKANGLPPPRYGTFALSEKNNMLILFEYLWAKELNGEKLSAFLTQFHGKALLWKDAISRGDVPQLSQLASKGARPKGMFGL
jgi:hypothetical protein